MFEAASIIVLLPLLPSPPLPADGPTGVVHSGVYVSDIPITLIQEVVGSHAIYGGNNVELAANIYRRYAAHAEGNPSIDRADFDND